MKIVFAPRTYQDFEAIWRYIAADRPIAATRTIDRIRQTIEILADHPKLGRLWTDGQTRALAVSGLPFRIHYRLDEARQVVEILTVRHTSRLPPELP